MRGGWGRSLAVVSAAIGVLLARGVAYATTGVTSSLHAVAGNGNGKDKGDKGDRGDKGDKGTAGPPGPAGPAGPEDRPVLQDPPARAALRRPPGLPGRTTRSTRTS